MTENGESLDHHRHQRGTVATMTETGGTGKSEGEALYLVAVLPARGQGADQGVEGCHQLWMMMWAMQGGDSDGSRERYWMRTGDSGRLRCVWLWVYMKG